MRTISTRKLTRSMGSLIFGLGAWLIIASLFLLVRLYGSSETIDWATGPGPILVMILLATVILGGIDWLGNLWINHSSLRSKPYWILLLLKAVSFVGALLTLVFLGRLMAITTGTLDWNSLLDDYLAHIVHPRMIAAGVYLALASVFVGFIRQCASMVGPRILLNLILGRYHRPREEELIFMFLDMKSSTTIAERLGHRKFSELLQDCFRDLTDVAIKHEVEIYKYIGDEAILTWNPHSGLANANCVETFFAFRTVLEGRRAHYETHYGCFPEFKAGLNMGLVTVAEVGVLKREIAYLSDVLNTAARIQEMCNTLDSPVLLPTSLRDRLPQDMPYSFTGKGSISLRGRQEDIELCSVTVA